MPPSAVDIASPTLGLTLPENAKAKLVKGGVDPEKYPTRPEPPNFLDEVYKIRGEHWDHDVCSNECNFQLTNFLRKYYYI